jgi:sortase A
MAPRGSPRRGALPRRGSRLDDGGERRRLLWVERFFGLLGASLLGVCAVVLAAREVVQTVQGRHLQVLIDRSHAAARKLAGEPPGTPLPHAVARTPRLAVGELLGRVEIPRVGVSGIILEGDDSAILRVAVGHVPGTVLPGQAGNAVLAAHRDSFFRPLSRVRPGDLVIVTRPSGVYSYRVVGVKVVSEHDLAVLRDGRAPVLTLLTCFPFHYIGSAPKRFIVTARLAKPAPSEPPS